MPPPPPSRRDFLHAAAALALSTLAASAQPPMPDPSNRGILRLRLQTAKLADLRRFYTQVLEFPIIDESKDLITFRAGATEITFTAADRGDPFYHVAFNIPENKLAASKKWLAPRTEILKRPDGTDEYHFTSWNAHAIYFLDPAGNILEFIARHNLRNASDGDFSARDILHASEIALVVDDVNAAVKSAHDQLGLDVFAGSRSDQFAAVGDDHRLLIIAKRNRPWNAG